MSQTVAIVGAGLAGLRAAEQLRAVGHLGPINVYGAEQHAPYNRPPLSKEFLKTPAGEHGPSLEFRRRASVEDVSFQLGVSAIGCDLAGGVLELSTGGSAPFDGLVIATGAASRPSVLPAGTTDSYHLRRLDDALQIAAALTELRRVVVLGGGFIGCEVAATLVSLGHQVSIIEAGPNLLQGPLGSDLASAITDWHRNNGIQVHTGVTLTEAEVVEGRLRSVALSSGDTIDADLIIEAIGSRCELGWLGENHLDLSDGVLVANDLSAAPNVVAVGDVARFPNPLFDEVPRRVEHWSMALDTAKRAARTLVAGLGTAVADESAFAPIPSFWSDQGELRLQSFGMPALADSTTITHGSLAEPKAGVVATYTRNDVLVAHVGLNVSPQLVRQLRVEFVSHQQHTN